MGHPLRAFAVLGVLLLSLAAGVQAATDTAPLAPTDPTPNDAPFVNTNMSDGDGWQNEISIAVDMAGRVFAGWNDWRNPEPDYRCGMTTSLDRGSTWSPNQLYVEPGYEVAGDPVAVTDSAGRTYLVCMPFNRSSGRGTLMVRTSLDGGQTWVNTAEIGISGLNNLDDKPWAAAYGDGIVVVLWNDYPSGGGTNLVARTTFDAGFTWSAPVYVMSGGGWYPGVDIDRYGRVHTVAVSGSSQRYRYSDDFGLTWSSPVAIATTGASCMGCTPRSTYIPTIASDPTGQDLYVVWSGDRGDVGGYNVYLAYSHDGGQSWTTRVVGDDTTNRQFMPSVDVDHDGVVHLLWSDLRSGQHAIYYANSTDGGVTVSNDVRVSAVEAPTTSFMGDYQQIVVDDWGRVHLGYCDSRNTGDAYYARAELSTPGPHWVNITPQDPTVPLGSTLQFTATVTDPFGVIPPPDPVEWRVSGGGTIDATGLFTPSALGTYIVSAYAGFRFDNTTVTIVPGPLDRINVVPPSAVVNAGSSVDFNAFGYDAWNNPVVPPITPTWARNGGGNINGAGLFTGTTVGAWTVYANASGKSGNASVTVNPGPLATITVAPPTATITADQTQQFTATGADAFGNPVAISPVWTATNGSAPGGLFAPWAVGTWTVYANQSGRSGNASVTVTPGALTRVEALPNPVTITADDTQQFTATGYDAKDNVVAINPTWTTNAGAVDANGLYTPCPAGTWVVTATEGILFDSADVTVLPGALATLLVAPGTATITADQTLQFTATGADACGNAVTPSPSWTAGAGTIDAAGLYTPGPTGTWIITATDGGRTATANVTVLAGALASILVDPAAATITADDTQQYTATGYDAKGNVVSFVPTWSATGGSVSFTGLYTPSLVGTYTVSVTSGVVSGSASVTVVPGALVTLVVSPSVAAINADQTQLFTATGYDARGNLVPMSPSWSVDGGSIDGAGLYTPDLVGTYTVTAVFGGVSDTASVTVTAGALASLVVTPPVATITADEVQGFSASGSDAKGNPVVVSPSWAVTGGSISGAGLYVPGPTGAFTVFANQSGLSGTALVTVVPGAVASVVVSPPLATITVDETQPYAAVARDARGNAVGGAFSWSTAGGSISPSGLYTPSVLGTFSVSAALGGVTGSASVTVTAGALDRLVVSPATATITADDTQQFTATGYDSRDNVLVIVPTWRVGVGTVSSSGLYTPTLVGTHTVTATAGALDGSATVTVVAGALDSLAVTPFTVTITADQTQAFTASGQDAQGNPVPVSATWSVNGGTVSPAGLYDASPVGAWTVAATAGGFVANAVVTVTPGAPALLTLTPETAEVEIDVPVQFTAAVTDADGNPVFPAIEWGGTGVGSVDGSGRFVSAVGGDATVTARVPGTVAQDTSSVRVSAPVVNPPPPNNRTELFPVWVWWILLLLAVSIPLILFLVWRRRKDETGKPKKPASRPPPPPPAELLPNGLPLPPPPPP